MHCRVDASSALLDGNIRYTPTASLFPARPDEFAEFIAVSPHSTASGSSEVVRHTNCPVSGRTAVPRSDSRAC